MSDKTCIIDGCDNRREARGWCRRHYSRWRRNGSPLIALTPREYGPPIVPAIDRLVRRVEFTDSCWNWLGGTSLGYGSMMNDEGQARGTHRIAYELAVEPIPAGLVIDHLCRNTRCVNPDHLEPVTIAENTLRGYNPSAQNKRKTHCKWGHEFTPENTYYRPDGKGKNCRTCAANRRRARAKGAAA